MSLHIPVSIFVARLVLLNTRRLNLPEAPLRQVDIPGPEIASQNHMSQPEGSRQRTNLRLVGICSIIDNLHLPVILLVTDGGVAVTGNFIIGLCDRGGDLVGMKVSASLRVNEADHVLIFHESDRPFGVERGFITVWIEEPVIIG